ncbi:caspase family protein [Catenulispora yoronensis]
MWDEGQEREEGEEREEEIEVEGELLGGVMGDGVGSAVGDGVGSAVGSVAVDVAEPPGEPETVGGLEFRVGHRFCLVIANYTYADERLPRLEAKYDADMLMSALKSPGLGGFEMATIVNASIVQIRSVVSDFMEQRQPGDTVLIYFVGHSIYDRGGQLYLLASDSQVSRLAATALDWNWFRGLLDECAAEEQFVLFDCPVGGASDDAPQLAELHAMPAPDRRFAIHRTFMAPSDALGRASIGEVLANGLRSGHADEDGDGIVSSDDAYTYVVARMGELGDERAPYRWEHQFGMESPMVVGLVPSPRIQPPVWTARATIDRVATGLAYSPDGSFLAMVGEGDDIWLWDVEGSRITAYVSTGEPDRSRALAFVVLDGFLHAVVAGASGRVEFVDWASGDVLHRGFGSPDESVPAVACMLVDGRVTAVIGHEDGSLDLWDVSSGRHLERRRLSQPIDHAAMTLGEIGGVPAVVTASKGGNIQYQLLGVFSLSSPVWCGRPERYRPSLAQRSTDVRSRSRAMRTAGFESGTLLMGV